MSRTETTDTVMRACNGFRLVNVKSILQNGDEWTRIAFANRLRSKANVMQVSYDKGLDLFDVTFYRLTRHKYAPPTMKELKKISGIYVDMLRELFEDNTGLYLTL